MSASFEEALRDAGGAAAPPAAMAGLRRRLLAALRRSREELAKKRSGYDEPVLVALADLDPGVAAVAPVDAALRVDPDAAGGRSWLVAAALVQALTVVGDGSSPAAPGDLLLRTGELDGHLLLVLADAEDAELAALAFEERLQSADRLRARALVVPAALLEEAAGDLRDPIGAGHPLRVAEAVARLGGDPVDPVSDGALEDLLPVVLGTSGASSRPHEDPDPARRVARRILQRLAGMGKWGGYHTEFAHLPRGFAGNDRALAIEVGEALLGAGLLLEKPSVGQRHVYLNSRRAADIYRLVDEGVPPEGLDLPRA